MHPNSLPNLRPAKPGERRNPLGRRPDPLLAALKQQLTDADAAEIANVLINKAMAGDLAAAGMLWDRLAGKPVARNEQGEPGEFDNRLRLIISRVRDRGRSDSGEPDRLH